MDDFDDDSDGSDSGYGHSRGRDLKGGKQDAESDLEDDDDDEIEDDLEGKGPARAMENGDDVETDEDEKIIRKLENKLGIKRKNGAAGPGASATADDADDSEADDEGDAGSEASAGSAGKGRKTRAERDASRKKRRLYREFAEDGLGEDFGDFLEGLESRIDARDYKPVRGAGDDNVEGSGEEEDDDDGAELSQSERESGDDGSDEEDEVSDGEDGEGSESESDDEDDEGDGPPTKRSRVTRPASDEASDSDEEEVSDSDAGSGGEDGSSDESGAPAGAPALTAGKYVPPHMRARTASAAASDGVAASSQPSSKSAGADARFATLSKKSAFLYGREDDGNSDDEEDEDEDGEDGSVGSGAGRRKKRGGPSGWDPAVPLAETPAVQTLRRRVQGLLNRLGESNIEPLANEIAGLYRTHPTADCNAVLLGAVLEQCGSQVQVLRPLVMVLAALLSALHVTVGPAVGAYALEQLTLRFADAAGIPRKPALTPAELAATVPALESAASESATGGPKLRNNLLLLLTYLYVFHVAHADLLGGALRLLAARFAEADAELLLLSLTYGGFQLRSDDPAALRDVLKAVHDKVAVAAPADGKAAAGGSAPAPPSSRAGGDDAGGLSALIAKFTGAPSTAASSESAPGSSSTSSLGRTAVLVELIMDLKNNRKRGTHEQLLERSTQLRKWLGRLASKASGGALEGVDRTVRVGWGDIMRIPSRGRWWLVGASWAGRLADDGVGAPAGGGSAAVIATGADSEDEGAGGGSRAVGAGPAGTSAQDAALLEAARAMRMNTPARKAVFVALLGAEDTDSALDRVLRLNLKGPAEREIVRVLIDCAAQEASYNPFYAGVGVRLCALHPRFKFTFQLALWDAFKAFGDDACTPRRLYNIARLLSALLCSHTLSLGVAKPLDFTASDPKTVLFLKALLTSLLLDAPKAADVAPVFTRLGGGPDRLALRDGVSVALHRYVKVAGLVTAAAARGAAQPGVSGLAQEQLAARLKAAKKALETVTGSGADEVMM